MKIKSAVTIILMVGVFMLGFAGTAVSKEYISMLTCGTAGIYYPMGGGIARIWNTYVPEVNATAETSGCSVVNLRLMEQGQAHTAICQNDAVYYSTKGLKFFEKKPAAKPRGVLMLYGEPLHIATTKQTGIKSIPDFKGRRVRVGYPGAITVENVRSLLEVYGITFKDMDTSLMSLSDSFKQMKDGDIDAMLECHGYPGAGFMDLAHHRDMVLLEVDEEHAKKMQEKFPFMASDIIPAGAYRGVDKDVHTVGVRCMVVASSDLSADLVYKLTKAIFEHLDILRETHAKGKLVTLETALLGMPIDLHPGAEKYYREVGKIK